MISELSWSMLDSRPVFVVNKSYDAHLCCWNGVIMTKTYAMMIIASHWNSIPSTTAVKYAAWKEFVKLYGFGVFSESNWDDYIDNTNWMQHHTFLENQLNKSDPTFLFNLKKKYSPKEALGWLMNNREIVLSTPEVV